MIIRRRNVFGDAIDDQIAANLGAGMMPAAAVAAATGQPPTLMGRGNLTQAQLDEYYHTGGYVPGLFDSGATQPPPFTAPPSPGTVTPAMAPTTQMVSNGVVADLMAQAAHTDVSTPAPTAVPWVPIGLGVGALALLWFWFGRQ